MEPPGTSDSRPPPPPVPCLELSSSGQFRDRTDDETETAGGAGSCRGACEGLGPRTPGRHAGTLLYIWGSGLSFSACKMGTEGLKEKGGSGCRRTLVKHLSGEPNVQSGP